MNCGSVDSLKVSTKWGLSPKARQIRLTAVWLIPNARASDRVDQCVASFGELSKVVTNTWSICSSVIVRGGPGRGASARPSSRRATNRERHLVTVGRDTPSRRATSMLLAPSAQASTIRQRSASAWLLLARRVQRSSVARSSSLNTKGGSLGPRRRPVARWSGSMAGTSQTSNKLAPQDTSTAAVDRNLHGRPALVMAAFGCARGR